MQTTLMGWIHQLGTLEYWEALLAGFEGLGPLVPILLAMVESFFPPLPLIAIVALNVAAHGGLLGFLYSWTGVALGGVIMFLFWRRLIKRFFWKVVSRSPKLEKAQQWVNRFDTSSLFMLSLLPFTPTSFMHFAFGMSDFDEKRYLRTVLLGKGLMVAMMAVFGQSLVSSLKNPVYLVLSVLLCGRDVLGKQKVLPQASSGIKDLPIKQKTICKARRADADSFLFWLKRCRDGAARRQAPAAKPPCGDPAADPCCT